MPVFAWVAAALPWLPAPPAQAREGPAPPAVHQLCPRIRFIGPQVALDDVEKKLVCGDAKIAGWSDIPLNQAEQFLRAFLQKRGRNFPAFKADDGVLDVYVGTPTYVNRLSATGVDGIVDLGKRRNIVGDLLTPAELDKFTAALKFELETRGYACPKINVTADARTGEIHADVQTGPLYYIDDIRQQPNVGVDPVIFRRYWAFQQRQRFDTRLLSLTSDRIQSDELFLSAYYDVACSTSGMTITQRTVEAPPRQIRVGVGADTEGYLRGQIQWKHSRVGYRASSIEVTAFDSFLYQSVDANMHYYLTPSDRLYLMPRAFFRRENLPPYQAAHAEASFGPTWPWDGDDYHLEVQGGPGLEYFNTLSGLGPIDDEFVVFDTSIRAMSHMFEYYQKDPREGWMAGFESKSRLEGTYSNVTAHELKLSDQLLWNLGDYHPPLGVLAVRGFAATTDVPDASQAFTRIPPSMRFFMGSDADFRGARFMELPNDAQGFLTAVYQGVELRAGDVLPYGLQPLVFVDGAMGSRSDFHVDPDVYWAPGVGLRWALPFGSLRGTAARGLVWARGNSLEPDIPLPHWQFYLTFGEEF